MIEWREALSKILAVAAPLGEEEVSLSAAAGRILARPLTAPFDLPTFESSAMDGYAVCSQELKEKSPELSVTAEIPAGASEALTLSSGEAARILTGGEIPKGADSVVRQEDVEKLAGGRIRIVRVPRSGENLRPKGEDAKRGDKILEAGRSLDPRAIGVAAAFGVVKLSVTRIPRAAVLPTGNEIIDASGGEPAPGEVFNSNGPMISAALRRDGALAELLSTAPDHPEVLRGALAQALENDLVVTSGGVSVGDYDHVRAALEELGVRIVFHQVSIRPGKPFLFGLREKPKRSLVFGLPGNPAASMVTYEMFVRPALRTMLGCKVVERPRLRATLAEGIQKKPGLTHFVRGALQATEKGWLVRPSGVQGSNLITPMVRADGLIVLESETENPAAGTEVEFLPWD